MSDSDTDIRRIDKRAIDAAAVDWHVRVISGSMRRQDLAQFEDWLCSSPDNAKSYARLTDLWDGMEPLANTDLVRNALEGAASERQSKVPRSPAHKFFGRSFPTVAFSAMASVVLIASTVIIAIQYQTNAANTYRTNIGEQQTIDLTDGSTIMLNTASAVKIEFSEEERRVVLKDGQVNFKIAKDAKRPFIVFAGEGSVRAIGTEFDVFRFEDRMTVTLLKGKVEVAAIAKASLLGPVAPVLRSDSEMRHRTELLPGEQIAVEDAGRLSPIVEVDVARVGAWREGKATFRNTPLGEAVAEMNRYSTSKIEIGDPALSDLRVSGSFRIQNSEHFVNALQTLFDIKVERDARSASVILKSAA